MRKSNGFMLMETLIVSVFVGITLVVLFIQLQNVSNSYDESFHYNTTNAVYNTRNIREYLMTRNLKGFSEDVKQSKDGYIDITDCKSSRYVLEGEQETPIRAYCKNLYDTLNVKTLLLSIENLENLKQRVATAYVLPFSQKFRDFIQYIKYDGMDGEYRLIVEFKDETFASIKIAVP